RRVLTIGSVSAGGVVLRAASTVEYLERSVSWCSRRTRTAVIARSTATHIGGVSGAARVEIVDRQLLRRRALRVRRHVVPETGQLCPRPESDTPQAGTTLPGHGSRPTVRRRMRYGNDQAETGGAPEYQEGSPG